MRNVDEMWLNNEVVVNAPYPGAIVGTATVTGRIINIPSYEDLVKIFPPTWSNLKEEKKDELVAVVNVIGGNK